MENDEYLKNKALYSLGRRAYTEEEMRKKLQTISEDEQAIDAVIIWLLDQSFLCDVSYTENYIRQHKKLQKHSPRKIAAGLRAKGVATELIKLALAENYSEEEAFEIAQTLLDKKFLHPCTEKIEAIKQKQKMYRFLQGRGFSSGVIISVIEAKLAEFAEEIANIS